MLYVQDPTYTNSYSLHEALVGVCSGANSGKGAYAFVSRAGADIFLGDVEVKGMLERGSYQLIVGIDQITTTSTIERLVEYQDMYSSLNVSAFLHNSMNSLFHPKISFFSDNNGCGSLVIGSGNLTTGGLRKNREVFAVVSLSQQELVNIEAYWNDWVTKSANYLKPLTDSEVLRRVAANTVRARTWKEIIVPEGVPVDIDELPSDSESTEESIEWNYQDDNLVLFAEIPKSGNRWNQANFDVTTFENFFGATAGDNSQRILLRYVVSDRILGNIEIRPSVSVKSQNYRFELEAAAGLDYPANGRPIGIFVRLSPRMFIYKLFMPDDDKYDEILDWMNANWNDRGDRMKRIIVEAGSVASILNQTPIHSFLVAH